MIFSDILTIRMKETVWILNISSKIFQGYIVQSAYLSCKLKFFWINNKLLIKTPLKSSFEWGVKYLWWVELRWKFDVWSFEAKNRVFEFDYQ